MTGVIIAWRKSQDPEAPERCEGLIKQMFDYSDAMILNRCMPDTFAINVRCCHVLV